MLVLLLGQTVAWNTCALDCHHTDRNFVSGAFIEYGVNDTVALASVPPSLKADCFEQVSQLGGVFNADASLV